MHRWWCYWLVWHINLYLYLWFDHAIITQTMNNNNSMNKYMKTRKIVLFTISVLNILSNIFISVLCITISITKLPLPLQYSLPFTLFSYSSITISFFMTGCLIIEIFFWHEWTKWGAKNAQVSICSDIKNPRNFSGNCTMFTVHEMRVNGQILRKVQLSLKPFQV